MPVTSVSMPPQSKSTTLCNTSTSNASILTSNHNPIPHSTNGIHIRILPNPPIYQAPSSFTPKPPLPLPLDARFIKRAVELADKSAGLTAPHPNFGCVIVGQKQKEEVVGEGYLYAEGTTPAELLALEAASGSCNGATAYLNMEPGDHSSISALVKAGIARVVIGIRHPSQHLRGNAIRALRCEGMQVDVLGEDLQSKTLEVRNMLLEYSFRLLIYDGSYESNNMTGKKM
ncbi:hypothetical protein Leryth_016439, partial [Lithospermum erythrorhizon]